MLHDTAAESAALRVAVLQGHLAREQGDGGARFDGRCPVAGSSAAAAFATLAPASAPDDGEDDPSLVQYSVALPEHLDSPGPWAVRR